MKLTKKFLVSSVVVASLAILGAAGAIALTNIQQPAFTRANDTTNHTLTITAEQIHAAIGAGSSGNFQAGGLEWHVDGASYLGGEVTISGGTLYNVTHSGESVNDQGRRGSGFKTFRINKTAAAAGMHTEIRDKTSTIAEKNLGADTSEANSYWDFSSQEKEITQVFMAFGEPGTTFTSVQYTYTCDDAAPKMTLSGPTELEVGNPGQVNYEFAYTSETPTVAFYSSNTSVATITNAGVITTLSAGKTTISATFTIDTIERPASNTIELTVTPVYPNIVDFNDLNLHYGIDITETGVATGQMVLWTEANSTISQNNETLTINYKKGEHFYSTQLFYREPYFPNAAAGHKYNLSMDINAANAGGYLDINVVSFPISQGDNHISTTITSSAISTLSIQFGQRTGVGNPNDTYVITNLKITDSSSTRHAVTFMEENGTDVHDNALVLNGQKVWRSIADPVSSNPSLSFVTWKAGEVAVDLNTWVPTGDTVLNPYFAESVVKHTVTFKLGSTTVNTLEVLDGNTIANPNFGYAQLGFGYLQEGIYTDSAKTSPYNFADTVDSDLTLYVKAKLAPTGFYNFGGTMTSTETTFVIENASGAAGDLWAAQMNFENVPNENGYGYTLSFEYRINHEGGKANLYDNAKDPADERKDLTVSEDFQTIQYSWDGDTYPALAKYAKLSFELGQASPNGSLKIEIQNFSLVATPKN